MNKYAMLEIKRGDVFWIKITDVVGHEVGKTRPYIVVSNDICNIFSPTITVIPITSKRKKEMPTHCTVNVAEKECTALCEHIITVSVDRILEKICHISRKEMSSVDDCLKVALGLWYNIPEEEEHGTD